MIKERVLEVGFPPLSGVLTPSNSQSDYGVVLLNSGLIHRIGASRINVTLARAIAGTGVDVVRFDFSGIGESAPRRGGGVRQRFVAEVQEVMDYLEQQRGITKFILAGLCSGAQFSLDTAVADDRIVGVVQMDPRPPATTHATFRRILSKGLTKESWRNVVTGKTYLGPWLRDLVGLRLRELESVGGLEEARKAVANLEEECLPGMPSKEESEGYLHTLMERNVSLYNIYTGEMELYTYRDQFREAYSGVEFSDRLTLDFLPDADHAFTAPRHQEWLSKAITKWIEAITTGGEVVMQSSHREGPLNGSRVEGVL